MLVILLFLYADMFFCLVNFSLVQCTLYSRHHETMPRQHTISVLLVGQHMTTCESRLKRYFVVAPSKSRKPQNSSWLVQRGEGPRGEGWEGWGARGWEVWIARCEGVRSVNSQVWGGERGEGRGVRRGRGVGRICIPYSSSARISIKFLSL